MYSLESYVMINVFTSVHQFSDIPDSGNAAVMVWSQSMSEAIIFPTIFTYHWYQLFVWILVYNM